MISVSRSAIDSFTRVGMLVSPKPGNSITIAPTRAKTSMKAAASAGSSETSMRMTECLGSNIRTPSRQALLRMLEPKRHSQISIVVRLLDLTCANATRGAPRANVKSTARRILPQPPMIRDEIRSMWAWSESAMNGSASSIVAKMARIFGT
ncbi:hypothetical protein BDS110ZK4_68310 [Bradyrhizobium diazoefficiens]|uniref:Uncharacterized protein n=1 Tax=Bradyrhizobium diazoefficiens TaxID=1355477 RepID=A0A809ZD37_9BRAD|nr:hypothetical protein XF1B_63060 [Bradyrhizobium diazoefficiens]BCE49885.1 hypothetical protein XF4B_62340 [Bradyrhizobium diazoefficiens]BCF28329.1 hypothetical protein XF14B_62810 [Bradyrhizobium diazoefficiens]